MATLGTPLTPSATRVMMLGAGELGKEVVSSSGKGQSHAESAAWAPVSRAVQTWMRQGHGHEP